MLTASLPNLKPPVLPHAVIGLYFVYRLLAVGHHLVNNLFATPWLFWEKLKKKSAAPVLELDEVLRR